LPSAQRVVRFSSFLYRAIIFLSRQDSHPTLAAMIAHHRSNVYVGGATAEVAG
jgi:hypothetical protein